MELFKSAHFELTKEEEKIHAATSIEKKTTNNFKNKLLSLNKVN